MIKLILLDVDGTLISSDYKLHTDTINAINRVRQKGVRVILSSGRSGATMRECREKLGILANDSYASALNGGTIFNGETMIHEEKMSLKDALYIIKEIKKFDDTKEYIRVYHTASDSVVEYENEYTQYYNTVTGISPIKISAFENYLTEDVNKVLVLTEKDVVHRLSAHMQALKPDNVNMFFSSEHLLEFTPEKATKGNSLLYFAKLFGLDNSEIFAMGDNFNDISMLKLAGVSACPANAADAVKAHADFVTTNTCDKACVAEALQRLEKEGLIGIEAVKNR